MIRNTTLAGIILAGGGMLFIASVAHYFFGLRETNIILSELDGPENLSQIIKQVWVLSFLSLLLCSIWGMFIGISIRKNLRYMRKQAMFLGGGLMVFGLWGFYHPYPNWHLGFFFINGLIIFLPGILLSKSQGPYF